MIRDRYFEYLTELVEGDPDHSSLLSFLFDFPFAIIVPRDTNRVYDGIQLRYSFADKEGVSEDEIEEYFQDVECSVLELMVALAIRCNEEIIYDDSKGNQAVDIFQEMLKSLGLWSMTDDVFGEREAEFVITRFINREYSADGDGGLFYIPNCKHDLRDAEIWYQMMWYLSSIE